ncbi:DUF5801 repeats-in-toxin domain-containing protein [Pseudomonas sp. B21-048]|uniref:DUF5801 repeats-in-toxin domain-containing protein n=1 Tax=Pseudomonas sp. B21-048 TaxID=2895490 RepID=UPI00215F39C2|nr:DUF5801 repeats-in-toxin domain-containing protein [Pseudomonas sp. B21-048]UVK96640.1 DUF5801 domain-containing protein [Pseudomonas sp. B21-048]
MRNLWRFAIVATKGQRSGLDDRIFREYIMAITTGTVTLDETTGKQNNDLGVGELSGIAVPAPLTSILEDALNEGATEQVPDPATTTVALSGYTLADPDGTEILDFTGLGTTPITDVKFSQDADGDPFDGSVTAKYRTADQVEHDLLTSDGYKIYLYSSGISNDAVIGRKATAGGLTDPDGDVVFVAYLDTNTITGVPATEELDAGATGAKVYLVELEPLQHPDTTNPDDAVTISNLYVTVDQFSHFSIEGAPSGQNLFLMFGDGTPGVDDNGDPANEVSIVVTATNPVNQSGPNQDPLVTSDDLSITTGGTISTSQGGGGTTIGHTNQMVDPGEALAFTFVTNVGTANNDVIVPNLSENEADVETNIKFTGLHTTTGATFTVVQLQQDKAATLTISASLADFAPAGAYIDELKLFDDGFVNINYVKVSLQKQVGNDIVPVIDPGDPNDPNDDKPVFTEFDSTDSGIPDPITGVTVTFNANGTVTLAGVQALDVIEYHTGDASGDLSHSRVVIANTAVNPGNQSHIDAAFDIGQFALRSSVSGTESFAGLVFEDDGPTASAALDAGAVSHDETTGNDGDANDVTGPLAAFAAVTTVSTDMTAAYAQGTASVISSSASVGGADGLASTAYSLNVASAGVDSGLDTTEGNNILLTKEGALVVGRISGGADNGEAAFAVAIDASTGVLSVVQYHSIKHPTGGTSHDESLAINNAALLAVATVTDGDGDTNAASVGIGARVSFQDDGPTASAALSTGAVSHDETTGNDGDANDVTGPLAAFAAVTTVSTDMTAAYAQGTASVINSSASVGGADGLASTAYSLNVASAGVDSGLDTTEGNNILLTKEGALVVGRISGGADNGEAAFAVAIDASTGVLSIVQYHSIKHPTGGTSHDESLAINNAALLAVATVTDGDGDTNAASVGIGARVSFQDDGPTASAALSTGAVSHDETTGNDGDANDVTGPLAAFAAVTTVSTDMTAAYAQGTASVISSSASVGGADGLASTAYSLNVASAGVDSGLDTTEGNNILLTKEGALVVGRISGGADNGEAAFAVAIDASTGVLSIVQYHSIKHPTGGTSHDESLAINNAALLAVATVTDGDGDTNAASVGIGARVSFQDDGPATSANDTVRLDDDVLTGNPGGTGDDVNSENVSGTLGRAFGQDGAGTVAYLTSGAPLGFSYVTDGTNLLVMQGTITVLTLTIVAATGEYSVVQNNPILHAPGQDENNQTFTINYRVTDGDGDTADGTLGINVDDDTPVVTAKSNLVYANANNPTPGGTGVFAYDIGADDRLGTTYSTTNTDFSVSLTGVSVGANAITNKSVVWSSENDTSAVFNVAFTYVSNNPNQGDLTNATGTLTFNKVADTYTLSLTHEIESFSILRTSTAQGFTGYAIGGTTPINQQPPVSVAKLADDFFVQFTGFAEAGGGTGADNIKAGGDNAFTPNELFSAATSWVSVSGTAAGVAGDTLQKGEVMDLDFFTANPLGITTTAPTETSKGIYLKFDGIGSEDLVIVLKLVNSDDQHITRAIIVDSEDIILKTASTSANNYHPIANPAAYGITLDQNDGAVIIESNDYNFGDDNYLIEGLQVLVSTEGVTGSGYNLNGNVGVSGASTGAMLTFGDEAGEGGKSNPLETGEAGSWDSDVVKIVDMGFVSSSTPDAHLTFDVKVTDADGDSTGTQTLDVSIAGGKTFTGGANVDTFSFIGLDSDTDVVLSAVTTVISGGFISGVDKLDFTAAGSGTNYTEVLAPVANLAAFTAAADTALDGSTDYYFGVVGGDGYLAFDGDGSGITNIIQLVGVTNIASTDIV